MPMTDFQTYVKSSWAKKLFINYFKIYILKKLLLVWIKLENIKCFLTKKKYWKTLNWVGVGVLKTNEFKIIQN